jgi:hypothetical protein
MKTIILFLLIYTFFFPELTNCGNREPVNSNNYALLPAKVIYLQSNNIHTAIQTDGILNFEKYTVPQFNGGFIYGSGSLIFSSGIWIGAKVNLSGNQKELRLAASFFSSHYSPGNIPVIGGIPPVSVCNDSAFNGYLVSLTDPSLFNGGVRTKSAGGKTFTFVYSSWHSWPVNLGAPYVEVNGLPGYQPGLNSDRPGNGVNNSRPDDLIFTVFMDYTNCTNNLHEEELSLPGGTLPLGVEIQQVAYAYLLPGLLNSYFVTYKIINKSGKNWDSVYFSLVNDGDVGDSFDDAIGCDSTRDLAYTYNYDNTDPIYGQAPPAVGYKIVQGPVIYTGLNTDTARFPCNIKVGYKMLKMSGHSRFINGGDECTGDPSYYLNAYNFMKGKDGCGNDIINPISGNPTRYINNHNGCSFTNWYDSIQSDVRNLVSTGPFDMATGDTQIVSYVYSADRGSSNLMSVCALIDNLERVSNYYYDCSGTIGIEPIHNIIPKQFLLEQNYPNPFNPNTSIKFSVPNTGLVSLVVYDALGRAVKELVNENVAAGIYSVDFNASDYPSGIFFYRLTAENFSETKKMVLVK